MENENIFICDSKDIANQKVPANKAEPKISVVERARRYVAKCPVAVSGQRGHDATFNIAVILVRGFALNEAEAMAVLRDWNQGCQPPWSEAELLHKVQSAANTTSNRPLGFLLGQNKSDLSRPQTKATNFNKQKAGQCSPDAPAPKPVFCPMVLIRIAAKARSVGDIVQFLLAHSPTDVAGVDSAGVLRILYPPEAGEKVLIFSDMKSQGQLLWEANRDAAIPAGPDGVWFLPQPVDGKFHPNPRLGGKMSRRSEESVTDWRYIVIESDNAAPIDWMRCLVQLPLKIVSICESGGRSIHALARLDATSKADWDANIQAIKPSLVTLGADAGALSAVRLTRLPQAARGARLQRLLFLNPSADGTPIIKLPRREMGGNTL